MDKARIIRYCDRAIEISLCAVAFYIPISNALIESFAGLAIAAWLVKKIVSGEFPARLFPRDFISLPAWLYIAAVVVSVVLSASPALSARHFVFKTVEYLLLFFIASQIRDSRVLRNILIALVFSVLLVSIDGIQQYFTGFDFLRGRPQVIESRINGPFTTPNDFSNYLVALLPLAACLSSVGFRRKWPGAFLRLLSVTILLCLVFSATRAAWIAVLAVLPMALLLRRRALFLSGAALVVLAVLLMPVLSGFAQSRAAHFFCIDESGIFDRRFLWKMAADMLAEKPFFGQGLGTFMSSFERFRYAEYPSAWGISYAHNCYLQMAAETGIFGLLSFCAVVSMLFYAVITRARAMPRGNFYHIICGLWLGVFAFLVNCFFDTGLYSLPLSVLFWMMMGLTVAALKISQQ